MFSVMRLPFSAGFGIGPGRACGYADQPILQLSPVYQEPHDHRHEGPALRAFWRIDNRRRKVGFDGLARRHPEVEPPRRVPNTFHVMHAMQDRIWRRSRVGLIIVPVVSESPPSGPAVVPKPGKAVHPGQTPHARSRKCKAPVMDPLAADAGDSLVRRLESVGSGRTGQGNRAPQEHVAYRVVLVDVEAGGIQVCVVVGPAALDCDSQ
jgi:hypothetical protein